MAVIGQVLPTIVDLTNRLDPDGKIAAIAEYLEQTNEVLSDMSWREGNLPTGERTTIRTELPSVGFRALNEGVPRSKSRTAQVDEGAAMLEGNSQVDRKEAILSGDIGAYRLSESTAFFQSMNHQMATTLFYGNSAASPKEFTGFAPRFDDIGDQVIDAGGTGTDNASIYLIRWGHGVTGIYPKNTKGGLHHMDLSSHTGVADDGFPMGVQVFDADGNPYQGYLDHYEWNCGLTIKDRRDVVRIANIDKSLLTKNMSSGADIQDLMVQAAERLPSSDRAVWYMPRLISGTLRRQLLNTKNGFLSMDDAAGRRVMSFDGIPVRRVDALKTDEARVI